MPIFYKKPLENNGSLAVWKITETPVQLLELLKKEGIYADVSFFRNENRLSEWLSARVLLATLGVKQKIIYNELGKPHLEGENANVSISHSGDFVATVIHPERHPGIDIEITGDRIHRVSHKFVNDMEKSWISDSHKTEQLYIIWGAKECAFKIYGLGAVDFRDNLEVEPFEFTNEGITRVHFKKGNTHCIYQVFFQYLDQVMLTYAIAS